MSQRRRQAVDLGPEGQAGASWIPFTQSQPPAMSQAVTGAPRLARKDHQFSLEQVHPWLASNSQAQRSTLTWRERSPLGVTIASFPSTQNPASSPGLQVAIPGKPSGRHRILPPSSQPHLQGFGPQKGRRGLPGSQLLTASPTPASKAINHALGSATKEEWFSLP
ncbi:unnamed protein product [Lepidochelys kempii]